MGAIGIIIAELVIKYGIPLAASIFKTWSDNLEGREPTDADFEALRVADPEKFFEKKF